MKGSLHSGAEGGRSHGGAWVERPGRTRETTDRDGDVETKGELKNQGNAEGQGGIAGRQEVEAWAWQTSVEMVGVKAMVESEGNQRGEGSSGHAVLHCFTLSTLIIVTLILSAPPNRVIPSPGPVHVIASSESVPVFAAIPEPRHVSADLPEPSAEMAATPEPSEIAALAIMAIAIWCVWGAHTSTSVPEPAPVHESTPEPAPVHESAPEPTPVHQSVPEPASI
ncbi:hypothetical protein DPX16_10406 [Anabarilius grahami]|uniref:Uncharacterized protein n=1 Tax=Anabarilius grahami TaxID=495550 RepID=A0A3N0Y576_ANAGA|nr:hypothetical protein DPX16_10406 [Anabarilius grahami]